MHDENAPLIQYLNDIQDAEMDALVSVSEATFECYKKESIMIQEGYTFEDKQPEFVQEGALGLIGFLTERLPGICDFFQKKIKMLFSRYKIKELEKQNKELKYQLSSQGARIEALEKALGGQAAVASGGEVTFAYDYGQVTAMMAEVKKQFDKLDIDVSDSALSKMESIIGTATKAADQAVKTVKSNKTVKKTMESASEMIDHGLDTLKNLPDMISGLRDKAVKKRNAIQKGKEKNAGPNAEQRLGSIAAGLSALLGKVTQAGQGQLQETERIQKRTQTKVTSTNHQSVVQKQLERAKERGDFEAAKKIQAKEAAGRKKAQEQYTAQKQAKQASQQKQSQQKPASKPSAPSTKSGMKKPK